ncbi:acyl-CoA dehydrogenase family protein [Hamadaea tsunoensis]|uniref:acyl-CoA dehydrogenase family protein n=1 Tax=Hamadaea tsunoensis TaxID=53368 RepID=UPI0004172ECC|nr:acyl-CoA dehydrogenase family protein [Hamadaea tsunoensis]
MNLTFDGELPELHNRGRRAGRVLVEESTAARDRHAEWDPVLFTELAKHGVLAIALPAVHGGGGATPLEAVALLEGFGEGSGDPGLALSVTAHSALCGVPISFLGSVHQRERLLPAIASGERVAAVALAETTGGAPGVHAVRTPNGWRLDGALHNTINAPVAGTFLLTAVTDHGRRTAFLLDRETPGLSVRSTEPAVLRTCPIGEVELVGCEVGHDAVLGAPGAAAQQLVPLLAALDRTLVAAPWLGLLRLLARRATELAATSDLARSQSVRLAVVDVHTSAELASGLLHRAAWELGTLAEVPRQNPAAAKLFLAGALPGATRLAAELAGEDPDPVVARLHRDWPAFTAAAGGTEVLRAAVAHPLLALTAN